MSVPPISVARYREYPGATVQIRSVSAWVGLRQIAVELPYGVMWNARPQVMYGVISIVVWMEDTPLEPSDV